MKMCSSIKLVIHSFRINFKELILLSVLGSVSIFFCFMENSIQNPIDREKKKSIPPTHYSFFFSRFTFKLTFFMYFFYLRPILQLVPVFHCNEIANESGTLFDH